MNVIARLEFELAYYDSAVHRFTPHGHPLYISENSAIKQHLIIKHNNSTNQLTYSDVRKILTDNKIIIYKNINKKR